MLTPTRKLLVLLLLGALAAVVGWQLLSGRFREEATTARLQALNACLAAANQRQAQTASGLLADIRHVVVRNRNRAADIAVLQAAQRIQARTQALTDTLQDLRVQWPKAGNPTALLRLARQVHRYTDTLWNFVAAAAPLDSPAEALFHEDWLNQSRLSDAPRPVVQAALTRLEARVRQLNREVLLVQAQKIGDAYDGFDVLHAVAAPAANTVAPGAAVEARLLLALGNGYTRRIRYRAVGQALPLDPDTQAGLVAWRVPAARPGQSDTMRAQWQGQAAYYYQLADTLLTITVPYRIVLPARP